MKIVAYYDCFCGICFEAYSSCYSFAKSRKELNVVTKSEGWKYDREKDINICPYCNGKQTKFPNFIGKKIYKIEDGIEIFGIIQKIDGRARVLIKWDNGETDDTFNVRNLRNGGEEEKERGILVE